MPLTKKGQKIRTAMRSEYGGKKGDSVFYASINKGKIKGAERGGKIRSHDNAGGFHHGGYGGKVRESAAAERREHGGPLRELREERPRWDTEGFGGKVMHPIRHASKAAGGRWK